MPQKPSFPSPPPLAPARVPAAHVQAAVGRAAQAKMPERPLSAMRSIPAVPNSFPVPPRAVSTLTQAKALASIPQHPSAAVRPLAPHMQSALGRAAQAKLPDRMPAPHCAERTLDDSGQALANTPGRSPHVQAAIAGAAPARLGSAMPARPTLRPASSKAAIQLAAAPPSSKAITLRGEWRTARAGSDQASATILGQDYSLTIKKSAQKHDDLRSADAVVQELNARSDAFAQALKTARESGNGQGSVSLASGNSTCSIMFEVRSAGALPEIVIFHAQRTASADVSGATPGEIGAFFGSFRSQVAPAATPSGRGAGRATAASSVSSPDPAAPALSGSRSGLWTRDRGRGSSSWS